jgi:hypothetical protein
MTPYLVAYIAYLEAGEMDLPWTDALDFHFQHGAVISTPELFVMARPVAEDCPDDCHDDLLHTAHASTTWHIYAAAGDLKKLLSLAVPHNIHTVTFQRRGRQKIHRLRLFSALETLPPPLNSPSDHTVLTTPEITNFLIRRAKELKNQLADLGHHHPDDFLKIPTAIPIQP